MQTDFHSAALAETKGIASVSWTPGPRWGSNPMAGQVSVRQFDRPEIEGAPTDPPRDGFRALADRRSAFGADAE